MKKLSISVARSASALLLLACFGCSGETTAPLVATTLAANSPTSLSGIAGAVVTPAPSVMVKDQNGSPLGGATVTFAVVSGGGSVSGATVTTDTSGIATVGSWTLGDAVGESSVSATVAGLPSVTFIAEAISSRCTVQSTHTFGTSSSGALSPTDCPLSDNTFIDFYSTSVPEAGSYFFRESAGFDTYLLLAMPDGTTIGENDDERDTGTNSGIKALLPSGNYLLGPGTLAAGVTGDYTISSTTAPSDVANCELVFVVKNITTAQNISTTDCNLAAAGATPIYSDRYFIFLSAGTSITINMTAATLDSFLQLVRLDGMVIAENDNIDATTKNSRITFTVTQTNYYAIVARAVLATTTGAYTLTIQ